MSDPTQLYSAGIAGAGITCFFTLLYTAHERQKAYWRGFLEGRDHALAAGTRSAETRSKAPSEGCQSGGDSRNAQPPSSKPSKE